jgi:hypothetical protein
VASNGSRTTRCDHDPQRRRTPRISARSSPHGDIRGPRRSPAYGEPRGRSDCVHPDRTTASPRVMAPLGAQADERLHGAGDQCCGTLPARRTSMPPQCPPASHDLPSAIFFFYIALFYSYFKTRIYLQLITDLGQRRNRRMRLVEIVSGGYDSLKSRQVVASAGREWRGRSHVGRPGKALAPAGFEIMVS